MRKNEILKLTWERVDFSRGALQLAETKNGRRREVPMNRAVYDVSNLPGKREEGPVFRRKDGAAWGDVRTAFEHACRRSPTSASTISATPAPRGSSCAAGVSRRCRRSSGTASSA